MKLNQLRALAAVAESGSIQEASRILHLTQPALSKAIKELESSVGAALFVRSSTGIRLTPYGQRLVTHARLISENVRRARDDLEDMKGTVASEITVGVTPVTAMMRPMAACLSTFRREFPNARLRVQEMRPTQLLEHLREGTMDFAVTSQLLPADRGLDCTQVCRLPTIIAARRGHPLRAARSVRALQQADWLAADPLSDTASPFHQLFAGNGLDSPTRVIECSSMGLALELCWQVDTLVLLSSESRASRIITETMDFIDVAEPVPDRIVSLVTRDRHVLTWAAARLHDALLQALASHYPALHEGAAP
ncbi:LysR substrate-binding domain-containing protein [Cupriavidus basilensis]|uniref:LysR substrate-binding domain-containing protein n=1 Tax=Cupriavidus basilensis TaxID=68895 RepID=A0ABT6AZG8_9BURK|nr:LysR substrate-binding domain-containing protein [Cupriavidus basilensis]MDF3838013.1 LysR substrate-binding domain-containing protein [Cupriavidus basilensis]